MCHQLGKVPGDPLYLILSCCWYNRTDLSFVLPTFSICWVYLVLVVRGLCWNRLVMQLLAIARTFNLVSQQLTYVWRHISNYASDFHLSNARVSQATPHPFVVTTIKFSWHIDHVIFSRTLSEAEGCKPPVIVVQTQSSPSLNWNSL